MNAESYQSLDFYKHHAEDYAANAASFLETGYRSSSHPKLRGDQDLLERAGHNHVFNEVAEHLKLRTVLEADQGVLWTDPETRVRVLFAHKEFDAGYLRPGHVRDVTRGEDLGERAELMAEALHTYVLSGDTLA